MSAGAGLIRPSILQQHDVRDGELTRVRKRQQRARAAHGLEPLGRATVKAELRRAVSAYDLDAGPEDAARVTGAKRLHRGFLGGEARGKRRGEVALGLAVRDFTFREDPPHEAIAVPLDHVRDALDFGRIEPDTYNLHSVVGS